MIKQEMNTYKDYLTYSEAAEFTRFSEDTLRNYVSRHKIPFIRPGRKVLFKKSDLKSWLENGGAGKYDENKKKKLF